MAVSGTRRSIVFLSVEWSSQERRSRVIFADFVACLRRDHAKIGARCQSVGEKCDGLVDWCELHRLPFCVATGSGAVVWIDGGEVEAVVEDAGAVGVEGLIQRTPRGRAATRQAWEHLGMTPPLPAGPLQPVLPPLDDGEGQFRG